MDISRQFATPESELAVRRQDATDTVIGITRSRNIFPFLNTRVRMLEPSSMKRMESRTWHVVQRLVAWYIASGKEESSSSSESPLTGIFLAGQYAPHLRRDVSKISKGLNNDERTQGYESSPNEHCAREIRKRAVVKTLLRFHSSGSRSGDVTSCLRFRMNAPGSQRFLFHFLIRCVSGIKAER